MKIILNGEAIETTGALTLAELLERQGFSGTLATAVNESFVPAPARGAHALNDGDRVEVLAPMQGG
jgi:sulfur carrier protein